MIRTVTIAVTLRLDVDTAKVDEDTLRRYIDKAIDNGIESGFDYEAGGEMGVTVVDSDTEIQLNPTKTDAPKVAGFELPDGGTAYYAV